LKSRYVRQAAIPARLLHAMRPTEHVHQYGRDQIDFLVSPSNSSRHHVARISFRTGEPASSDPPGRPPDPWGKGFPKNFGGLQFPERFGGFQFPSEMAGLRVSAACRRRGSCGVRPLQKKGSPLDNSENGCHPKIPPVIPIDWRPVTWCAGADAAAACSVHCAAGTFQTGSGPPRPSCS
jgi:hypothetical protein